jgi:hypothetical protein
MTAWTGVTRANETSSSTWWQYLKKQENVCILIWISKLCSTVFRNFRFLNFCKQEHFFTKGLCTNVTCSLQLTPLEGNTISLLGWRKIRILRSSSVHSIIHKSNVQMVEQTNYFLVLANQEGYVWAWKYIFSIICWDTVIITVYLPPCKNNEPQKHPFLIHTPTMEERGYATSF